MSVYASTFLILFFLFCVLQALSLLLFSNIFLFFPSLFAHEMLGLGG
jgi:hypothetical protein